MKRIALFIALAVTAIACQTKEEQQVTPEVKILTAESELILPTDGGPLTIDFSANVDWTAELTGDINGSIAPKSGKAGEGKVTLTAMPNQGHDNITATVTIKAQGAEAKTVITQLQKDAIVAGATSLEVPAEGGEVTVKLGYNVDYEVNIEGEWLTQVTSKAYAETDLVFNAEANTALEARTATVTVTAGELSQVITVTQAGFVPSFEMDKTEIWLAGEGSSDVLYITANFEYSVAIADGCDWLTVSNDGDAYTFTAVANPDLGNYRSVEVIIEGYTTEEQKFYVFQGARGTISWQKTVNTDWYWELNAAAIRTVVKGDYLLIANASNVVKVFNKATGDFLKDITLPEGMVINSLDLDDAGNIVLAGDFPWGGSTTAYYVTELSDNPELKELGTLSNMNYWSGNPTGNFRVGGDVTKNAVIVGIIGGVHQYMAFEVQNGEFVAKETWAPVYQPSAGTVWLPQNAAIYPLGDKIADGFLYTGYSAPYDVWKNNGSDNEWTTVISGTDLKYAGNEIPNAIDIKTIDGKTYMAVGCGAVFTYSAAGVQVYDVTDWANVQKIGRWLVPDASSTAVDAGSQATKHGQGSDVVIEDTEDGFTIYHASAGNQRVSCVAVK